MTQQPAVRHLAPAFAALIAVSALAACSGSPPPPPVPVASATPAPAGGPLRPLSSRDTGPAVAAPAEPVDQVDPAEPGISDLARTARYVFRVMRTHEDVCAFANPYDERIHFALAVEVKSGRFTRIGLGHAGTGEPPQERTLSQGELPPELAGYVACLEPHLRELVMSPAPADGVYEPIYQHPGRPGGRRAP
jgi:hypothetical protein